MSKARITYRFDQETQLKPIEAQFVQRDRIENEAPQAGIVIPLYEEDPEFAARNNAAWRSPYDAETERIEQLIRNSERESELRKGRRVEQSATDRIVDRVSDPETPNYYTAPEAEKSFQNVNFYSEHPVRPTYRRRDKNNNWFSITTSITGAILTGILLGMFVLSMFNEDTNPLPDSEAPSTSDQGLPAVLNESGEPAVDVNKENNASGAANDSPVLTTAMLPEQTYHLIQFGVFSTLEGANIAVQQLKDMGLSGAVSHANQFSVFAGAAMRHEDALLISHYLQNSELEVFIKSFVLPSVQQISWAGQAGDQIQAYLEESRTLVKLILDTTAVAVQDSNSAIAAGDKQLIKQQHQIWTEAANQLALDASGDVVAQVQQMNKSLNGAVLTIDQYDKNPTDVYLWQAQAAISEHVIAQKQFIDAIKLQ